MQSQSNTSLNNERGESSGSKNEKETLTGMTTITSEVARFGTGDATLEHSKFKNPLLQR